MRTAALRISLWEDRSAATTLGAGAWGRLISPATLSPSAWRRQTSRRLAPRLASAPALALPMPRLAPVTTQTRPVISAVIDELLEICRQPVERGVKYGIQLGSG